MATAIIAALLTFQTSWAWKETPRGYGTRALAALARLNQCDYTASTGTWNAEGLWQSGNTLEALADLAIATANNSLFADVIANSYDRRSHSIT
jgi:hypothetical protein